MLKDLVASTLIILPKIAALWAKLIPADCIHRLSRLKILTANSGIFQSTRTSGAGGAKVRKKHHRINHLMRSMLKADH